MERIPHQQTHKTTYRTATVMERIASPMDDALRIFYPVIKKLPLTGALKVQSILITSISPR